MRNLPNTVKQPTSSVLAGKYVYESFPYTPITQLKIEIIANLFFAIHQQICFLFYLQQ